MYSPLSGLATLRSARTKRISSFDRTGGNADYLTVAAGETATLASIKGAGIIRHIWITIACEDPMHRRNVLLRMYWDGQKHPSVESPLGDFFGQGWGEFYNYAPLPLAAAPKGGRALNCYFPMPFVEGARIEIENQSDCPLKSFYYYVDYEEHQRIVDDMGRFHAWWNREMTDPGPEGENDRNPLGLDLKNPSDKNNYLFFEAVGHGHYVGVNYYVHCPTTHWYGEGDDMFLVDGEEWPGSLHGTGTEDYFNTSWCPKEPYQHPYFGYGRLNNDVGWLGRTHVYRFHLEDPVIFRESIRASIEHGHANVLTLDLASVAYWYQTLPSKPFPLMPLKKDRQPLPDIDFMDIHRWRHAWRVAHGGGKLWGNEK